MNFPGWQGGFCGYLFLEDKGPNYGYLRVFATFR
jgi:hypothetical protein